ncbi:AP-5 complex subunit beta-1-like isoform X2 [Oculina patagonica]
MFIHPYKNMLELYLGQTSNIFLHTSSPRLEPVIGSRKDMIAHSSVHSSQIYLSQILVTGTVILISKEMVEISQDVFVDFVGVLTDVIEMVNNPYNLLVRRTACECLWEMELSYPGVLHAKLDHLYAICAAENSPIFQSYMVLFVTVLRHAIELLLQESANKLDDGCLNNLLTSRTEPLKPLYLPKEVSKAFLPVTIQAKAFSSRSLTLPGNVDTRELKRAISFLMDNIGFLNTIGLFHVMFQLMQCVKLAELAPNTFKSQFITWVSTTDLSVFHVLLLLKLKFLDDLFLEGDELLLLQRMLLVSSQPTLPQGQRLLCFEWLMYFPIDEDTPELQPSVPHCLDYSQFNFFYPSVFDSLDITVYKLKVLCLCLDHETLNLPGSMGVPLMQCLAPLLKRVQQGIGGKTVVALFRSIFWYYKHHWDSELEREIYKLVLSIVTDHPQFIPHTVDLLNSVTVITPDSTFPSDLLRSLSEHVVSQPVESILPNLTHHLKLLSLAMRGSDIPPTPTIRFLVQILEKSEITRNGNWTVGNCVLAVCYSVLLHHHSSATVTELGNLLLFICATYRDIDIRDRAKFYYCLLTNVSSKKCSKILASETARQGLPHVIADDITTSTFPVSPPVKHVNTPFLKLTRVPRAECEGSLTDMKSSALGEKKEFTNTRGLLEKYLKMFDGTTYSKEIPITYYVHFTESQSLSKPSIIYALVLKFHSERRYKKLEDVHISYLSVAKSTNPSEGCCQITVNYCPLDPVPAAFQVRAIFSDESGLTCAMKLDDLPVHFSDLFIPLEVPAQFKTVPLSTLKAQLFSVLWDHITEAQHTSENPMGTGAESIVCLSVEWGTMGKILEERLLTFVMSASDDEVLLGIFLPPHQHLLLKFRPLNESTVVSVATDDWRMLQLVESYLRQFERVSG